MCQKTKNSVDSQVKTCISDTSLELDDLLCQPLSALGAVLRRIAVVVITPWRPRPGRPNLKALFVNNQLRRLLVNNLPLQNGILFIVEGNEKTFQGILV